MNDLKSGCPFCGAGPHEGPTKVQYDQLHGEPFQNYQFWCPHGHASVTAADRERALEIWNTRTPPPGYALVKLEGAEERVAHIVEAGVDLQSGHQAIAREIIRAMREGE